MILPVSFLVILTIYACALHGIYGIIYMLMKGYKNNAF